MEIKIQKNEPTEFICESNAGKGNFTLSISEGETTYTAFEGKRGGGRDAYQYDRKVEKPTKCLTVSLSFDKDKVYNITEKAITDEYTFASYRYMETGFKGGEKVDMKKEIATKLLDDGRKEATVVKMILGQVEENSLAKDIAKLIEAITKEREEKAKEAQRKQEQREQEQRKQERLREINEAKLDEAINAFMPPTEDANASNRKKERKFKSNWLSKILTRKRTPRG